MKREQLIKALGISCFLSLFLPYTTLSIRHNCTYDKCLLIYRAGDIGECVEKSIDNLYLIISILWFITIMGGAMILQKNKNAISPFVFMVALIGASAYGASMDPSKWSFVISLLPSFVIVIILAAIDNRNRGRKQED
jgi:hypothetical protein